MRNGEWAKEVEGRPRLSLLSGIGARVAVATPTLDGIENAADIPADLLEAGVGVCHSCVALLHPGKDLADVLSILLARIHLPGNNLGKVADHDRHGADFFVQLAQADLQSRVLVSQLGKLARSIHYVIPQDPREPFQSHRLVCTRHRSPHFPRTSRNYTNPKVRGQLRQVLSVVREQEAEGSGVRRVGRAKTPCLPGSIILTIPGEIPSREPCRQVRVARRS